MNFVQVTVYLGIIQFLSNNLEREQARKSGIMEMDVDLTYETYIADHFYEERAEWVDLWHNIIARHHELETLVVDMQPMIEGCSDVCDGEGTCKLRGENKGIWEV